MIWALILACGASPAPDLPYERGIHVVGAEALRTELTGPRSRPRMHNYWATWCAPCVAELPRIARFAASHPEVDVVLVNVEYRSQRAAVGRFVEEKGLSSLRVLMVDDDDPDRALRAAIPDFLDSVPVTEFVRSDGTRAKRFVGEVSEDELMRGLGEVLGR